MRRALMLSRHGRTHQSSISQAASQRFVIPSRAFHPQRPSVARSPTSHHYSLQKQPRQQSTFVRHGTDLAAPSSDPSSFSSEDGKSERPQYELYFTCKPCRHRSGPHRITKQGYHYGTTLIRCPSCKQRHIISDHLNLFGIQIEGLEEIMAAHGDKLKKGKLGIRPGAMVGNEGEEEIEFWEDGTETPHIRTQQSEGNEK